ncbi:hypothetical protein [Paenibacillus oceani]|uniref:Uncharacterized protein n=1 Tax=Paenibacillus oceani TaxID=2772510 RepID=A0A927C8A8_9BACL|nr:hypothetical protein [Paenibacillus oceani]MBD2863249.1 hypothetical protein [Paenibacillus oceani]
MGASDFGLVTITLASIVQTVPPLPPVTIPVGVNLLTNVPYPYVGSNVTIDLLPILGVDQDIIVPVPGVTAETVVITPVLSANLIVTVTEGP